MAGPRRWRAPLLKLHRWIALSAGLLLVLNAFTGLVMLAGRPIDEALNPQLFTVQPQVAKLPLETLRQSLKADFPAQNLTLWPGRGPQDPMVVNVRGDTAWEGRVYVDPYSGRRLGQRGRFAPGLEGLFELHSSLLSDKTGKGVLAFAALCMAVMLASGLVLWWPLRWKSAFSVTLKGPRLRTLFDLHRVGGATLGLWVLVCVGSGALLAYRPVAQWVNQLAGASPQEPPKLAAAARGTPPVTLDALVAAADAALPGGEVGAIVLPAKASQPMRVRKKMPDDPHPIGLSSIWLNPRSGELLRVDRWDALPPGERMYAWVYPLHSGQLAGALGVVITAGGGLLLLGFGVSGTWLWWLRRAKPMALKPRTG